MKTLAIIGTAGRKEDAFKLTLSHWEKMVACARRVITMESITHLVSGGAAWADHTAVELSTKLPTTIWLPSLKRDLDTMAYYHKPFSETIQRDTMRIIEILTETKELTLHKFGSFKDRNTRVADAADCFLAMTFGSKGRVKDGGTADTVAKMLHRGIKGYHLDLNTCLMYHARLD